MKNKHLLKVLSIGALSSLLVVPLVLNGVSDSVQEEPITQSVEESQRSVKRAKLSDNSYSVFYQPSWAADMTYEMDSSGSGYYWISGSANDGSGNFSGVVDNNLNEGSQGGQFLKIKFNVTKGKKYIVNFLWSFNQTDDSSGAQIYFFKNSSALNMTTSQVVSQKSKGFFYEFISDETDETSYEFTADSDEVCLLIDPQCYDGFYYNLGVKISTNFVDTEEPVVTSSKYSISLPVKTSTRLTKEYLLNQKVFKVTDDTDGDITDRLVIKSGNINYDKTGTYPLLLSWTDNAGNESTLTFNVLIGDFEKPTYSVKQSTMYVECPNKLSVADLLNNVTFSDNYDTNITKTIVTNNYNQNTNCGTYSVTIRGTDTSGNYTDATFNVCVRDTIAPTITGITNNQVIKSANVKVSDSGSGIKSVTIDDKSVILADGEFVFNASSYADGTHTLKATDNQGNGTIIKFISDKSAPKIVGIDSSTRLNKSVSITLIDIYSNIVSFKLNGTLIEVNAQTKAITIIKNALADFRVGYYIKNDRSTATYYLVSIDDDG